MSLYRGIAYVVTGGVPVTNVPTSYRDIFNGIVFGGVRNYIIVMVVVFVIAHILLSKSEKWRLLICSRWKVKKQLNYQVLM